MPQNESDGFWRRWTLALLFFGAALYLLIEWFSSEMRDQSRKSYEHCVEFWGGTEDAKQKCK